MKALRCGAAAPRAGTPWNVIVSACLLLLVGGCEAGQKEPNSAPARPTNSPLTTVREPAVAGLFYPAQSNALVATLKSLLSEAPLHQPGGQLKALICPHAGYRYSGPVAARAYKAVNPQDFDNVWILAPTHYALFQGASVPAVDGYRTPLGIVPVSSKARLLAQGAPFVVEKRCLVQRPSWWGQAPKSAPANGQDTPDTWEHSAEVQIPFLQALLPRFSIVPMILSRVDPIQLARALTRELEPRTLVVASSDLSHYLPYEQAKVRDQKCVEAICQLNPDAIEEEDACGRLPIQTLIHMARLKGWKPRLLDCRNSGDITGEKQAVVGYCAVGFYAEQQQGFAPTERKKLLELARRSLNEVVRTGKLPNAQTNGYPAGFLEPKGCFVTLTRQGALRGCIGHILPQEALYRAIMDNAQSAALRDPRFRPVQPSELGEVKIEISVLTEPEPVSFGSPEDLLAKLKPHEDGVVLKMGPFSATYLPQVWEQLPDKKQFMDSLALKAGCPASAWRESGTRISLYHVESFQE